MPITVDPDDLSAYVKRLRAAVWHSDRAYKRPPTRLRFFASGEYGERTSRPHYHIILFGLDRDRDRMDIESAWQGRGFVQVDPISPQAISYVAGYVAKKIGARDRPYDVVDPETGEFHGVRKPPFLQMSRRPGIGGHARRWVHVWRDRAVFAGSPVPVPRYFHDAWKSAASDEQINQLKEEKQERAATRDTSKEALYAAETNVLARFKLKKERRDKL